MSRSCFPLYGEIIIRTAVGTIHLYLIPVILDTNLDGKPLIAPATCHSFLATAKTIDVIILFRHPFILLKRAVLVLKKRADLEDRLNLQTHLIENLAGTEIGDFKNEI